MERPVALQSANKSWSFPKSLLRPDLARPTQSSLHRPAATPCGCFCRCTSRLQQRTPDGVSCAAHRIGLADTTEPHVCRRPPPVNSTVAERLKQLRAVRLQITADGVSVAGPAGCSGTEAGPPVQAPLQATDLQDSSNRVVRKVAPLLTSPRSSPPRSLHRPASNALRFPYTPSPRGRSCNWLLVTGVKITPS